MSMSGWWLAASAAAPTERTNSSAAAKSCSFTVVVSSSPSWAQCSPCSSIAASTSDDVSMGSLTGASRVRHVLGADRPVELRARQQAQLEGRFAQRRALLVRRLGDLRRVDVADDGVE